MAPPSTSKSSAAKGKAPAQPAAASSSNSPSATPAPAGRVLSPAELEEKLAAIKAASLYVLAKYGHLYLPDSDSVERYTTWGRDSIGDVVVFKGLEDAKVRYAAANGGAPDEEEEDENECKPPVDGDPVTFHLITTVDKAGSQLASDANWQGTSNSSLPDPPKFDKVALKVRLGPLARQFAMFTPDHVSAVENLRKLLGLRAKSEYNTGPSPDGFFALSHKLFSKLSRSSVDGSVDQPDVSSLPSFYDIRHYPFHTTHAITDVKSLIPNHQVVPLPAYENGNIVNPNAYEDTIGGSLVHASFKLRHYFIRKQSVFSYELVELNVVSRGSEGTKRKAGLKSNSPMKKMHLF